MRKIALLALVAALFAAPAAHADFTAKDASAATITFKNPGACASVVCVPIFAQYDSTGANAVAVLTAGADAASNTATGSLVYNRNLVFNGTTWDRWQGVVSAVALGAVGDAAWTSGNGSVIALLKAIAAFESTTATNTGAAVPPQSATIPIGGFGLCDGANGATNPCTTAATVKAASTAAAAADKALVVGLSPNGATPALGSQYPFGATAITASATGTTGATTATLAGTGGKTTYICSLSVRANATANANVTNTVTGVITGTLSRAMWVPANTAGLGVDEQIYNPCVPASATNTGIAVVSGAPGTGGVVTVNATGYQL